MITRVVALLSAFSFSFSYADDGHKLAGANDIYGVASGLISAVKDKDVLELRSYLLDGDADSALDELDLAFVLDGEDLRKKTGNNDLRSIHELISLGSGSHSIRFSTNGKSATMFYVPDAYVEESKKDPAFFDHFWAQKYFACLFQQTKDGWKMIYTFCYSQTDGPISRGE